jgi:hypothetical protein
MWFKTKGWPHFFSMQMIMQSLVCTRGTNMFHPLQHNPENDEQEEDEKAEGGKGDRDKTGLANVSWPPSDDEQSIDPILHTLTTSMDAPASTPLPTFSAPPFTLSALLLALHKQKCSALMGLASISTTPSPSSMLVLSRKQSHISKPSAPALHHDTVALGCC